MIDVCESRELSNDASYLAHKIDADTHEMIPIHMWAEHFGPTGSELAGVKMNRLATTGPNRLDRSDIVRDDDIIEPETVWRIKGAGAPSAIDLRRRPDVMDVMGVDRQLVFPTFALVGSILLYANQPHVLLGCDLDISESRRLGRAACEAHNDWAIRITNDTKGRARPVGLVTPDTVADIVTQTEYLIGKGIRAIMLPAGIPPANTSPADPAMDEFWSLLASRDVPFVLHLGTEFGFLASPNWSANVPEFEASDQSSVEFQIEPYRASTLHLCMQNYLTTMILGGVFERFPSLRVGIIETSAHWIGPLADALDVWALQFKRRLSGTLSVSPSEYISRSVRVTPFYFEPVGTYLEKYPLLSDVYCYSSDFPHVEGGIDPQIAFLKSMDNTPEDLREKFFRGNGLLLLPDDPTIA